MSVEFRMSNVQCRMSKVECRMSNVVPIHTPRIICIISIFFIHGYNYVIFSGDVCVLKNGFQNALSML